MKSPKSTARVYAAGRSPCGERGLKFSVLPIMASEVKSLPVRGAWIEIEVHFCDFLRRLSLPMRGAWIEIAGNSAWSCESVGRSPCGERGLKSAI